MGYFQNEGIFFCQFLRFRWNRHVTEAMSVQMSMQSVTLRHVAVSAGEDTSKGTFSVVSFCYYFIQL